MPDLPFHVLLRAFVLPVCLVCFKNKEEKLLTATQHCAFRAWEEKETGASIPMPIQLLLFPGLSTMAPSLCLSFPSSDWQFGFTKHETIFYPLPMVFLHFPIHTCACFAFHTSPLLLPLHATKLPATWLPSLFLCNLLALCTLYYIMPSILPFLPPCPSLHMSWYFILFVHAILPLWTWRRRWWWRRWKRIWTPKILSQVCWLPFQDADIVHFAF